jgi:hypothetical protein
VGSSNTYCSSCAHRELGIARLKIHAFVASRAGTCQKTLCPTPIKISGRVSLGALALKLVVGEDAEMLPKISGRIARRNQQRLGGRPDRDRRAFSSQCHRPW